MSTTSSAYLNIGSTGQNRLNIVGRGIATVAFDVNNKDRSICSDVSEDQARQIVAALVEAFPAIGTVTPAKPPARQKAIDTLANAYVKNPEVLLDAIIAAVKEGIA